MTEKAKVLEVHGHQVELGFCDNEACKSCAGSICKVEDKRYRAVNEKGIRLEEGDLVDVFIEPGKTLLASFMLLIFPLVLFFVCYLLGEVLLGIASEGGRVLLGLGGLALGFGINLYVGRLRRGRETLPKIIRKLE
jgi:positive regulator of sigma E activity